MAVRYLIDTTVLIDHAKARPGIDVLVATLFAEPNDLLVCDVVVAEALSGGDERQITTMRSLIRALEYVSTHPDAAIRAGEGRRRVGLLASPSSSVLLRKLRRKYDSKTLR